MLHWYNKAARQAYLLGCYSVGLAISYWLAFHLRFDFAIPPQFLEHYYLSIAVTVGVKLLLLLLFGQFGSLLSYFGFHDLGKILAVCSLAAALSLGVWLVSGVRYAPPRGVIVTDLLISFLFLCGFRLSLRLLREGFFQNASATLVHKRVAIFGAGDVGAALARDLQMRQGLGMVPVAFFDDNRQKWGSTIHGVVVEGSPETLPDYLRRHKIDEVILAMPSASGRRVREMVSLLNQLHLRFEIVPSYTQLLQGKVRISQMRPVEFQDLLGREPVDLQSGRIHALVHAKVVMVTGAGGSIGGELCRQIAAHLPRQLLLVERSEFLLFQIQQELLQLGFGTEIIPLVADIMDESRMRGIFKSYAPSILFHAAAHKHVPMMESQPAEAFRNNVTGTRLLADLALKAGVERFILISTDKAINPTSVMGATKRVAELYIQALQQHSQGPTKFMAVRFGNVLGSSGSVIPTFKRQIAMGGPVTVTHPEMTRYFMTVNEAAGLVLQSATLGRGGEIFVLDMGKPMKIVEVARQLIELSGMEPDTDIEIQFTGLRPGEKLYEELNHDTENHVPTEHAKIMLFLSDAQPLERLRQKLEQLHAEAGSIDPNGVKQALKRLVPEYNPYLSPFSPAAAGPGMLQSNPPLPAPMTITGRTATPTGSYTTDESP
jgi:FlaA1/EpsC-like NDP-sugar epimerase